GEEVCDLDLGVVEAVRAVDGVLADAVGVGLADGALRRVRGVGGAHQIAVARDGVLALEHAHDDGAARHEVHELTEEGALLVHGVEPLGRLPAELDHARRADPEAGAFDHGEDVADVVLLDGVGLDDAEGAFDGHDASRVEVLSPRGYRAKFRGLDSAIDTFRNARRGRNEARGRFARVSGMMPATMTGAFDVRRALGEDFVSRLVRGVLAAGRGARAIAERGVRAERKSDQSPVTEADRRVEARLRAFLEAATPGATIFGEEEGTSGARSSLVFHVDPIDGTRAFLRGIPTWSILVGLEDAGVPVFGLAYMPSDDDLFVGSLGGGAYHNGRPLAVSDV